MASKSKYHSFRKLETLSYLIDAGTKGVVEIAQMRSWLTHGGQAELRLRAAQAVAVGKLSAVRYFVEEKNVPITSITLEEQRLIDRYHQEKRVVLALRYTLLSLAVGLVQEEVANYLMGRVKKEELDARDNLGFTCLMSAAYTDNLHAACRLLDLGTELQAKSFTGYQPIYYATIEGHVKMVDLLLEYAKLQGGDGLYQAFLKQPCRDQDGPLIFGSVVYNHLPLVEYLHEKQGPDVLNQVFVDDKHEYFLHHLAALKGYLPMLEWLLAQGVPVDLSTPTEKLSALNYACVKTQGQEKSEAQAIRERKCACCMCECVCVYINKKESECGDGKKNPSIVLGLWAFFLLFLGE